MTTTIYIYLDKIGDTELIGYFKKLGVEITSNEAKKLVEKYLNFY